MQTTARENYLVTEVMTAPPQKLQLLMIDAAIRACRKARQRWQSDDAEAASESLIRAQQIVTEIVGGIQGDKHPDLARKVAAVYLFIYRALVDAHLNRDETKLAEALRVLEFERETWQQLCQELGTKRLDAATEPAGADFSA